MTPFSTLLIIHIRNTPKGDGRINLREAAPEGENCKTPSGEDGRISPFGTDRAIRLNKVLPGFAGQNFIPLLSLARSPPEPFFSVI
jgi:hypothetical protein